MAMFSTPRIRYLSALFFLILYLRILNAQSDEHQNKSFSFKNFGKDSNFESELSLYGDAKLVNGSNGVSIQVSSSMVNSSGAVVHKKPFKLFGQRPRKMASFSLHVVFSMSIGNGDGLVFMMVPLDFPLKAFNGVLGYRKHRFFGVKIGTKYDDVNGKNHVGSFVSVNVSSVSKMVFNSSEKLQAWIDYEAKTRLEVRLSNLGENKPLEPLLSCPVEDLSEMWKGLDEEVVVGLSASNGNSKQECNVYSWRFSLWSSSSSSTSSQPHWMHSQPLDPNTYLEKRQDLNNNSNNDDDENENENLHKKSDECALRVLGALVFGVGCGALGALIVLFIWAILGNRRPIVPEDYAMPTKDQVDEFKLQKIVVDKTIQDGNK